MFFRLKMCCNEFKKGEYVISTVTSVMLKNSCYLLL